MTSSTLSVQRHFIGLNVMVNAWYSVLVFVHLGSWQGKYPRLRENEARVGGCPLATFMLPAMLGSEPDPRCHFRDFTHEASICP